MIVMIAVADIDDYTDGGGDGDADTAGDESDDRDDCCCWY